MGGCVSRKSIVNKNDNGIINYNVINQSYLENRKRFLIIQNNMNKCFKENSKFHDKIKAIYSCQLYMNELWSIYENLETKVLKINKIEFYKYLRNLLSKKHIENYMMVRNYNIKNFINLKIRNYSILNNSLEIIEKMVVFNDLFPINQIFLNYKYNLITNKIYSFLDINETINFDNDFMNIAILSLTIDITYPIDPNFIIGISQFIESNKNLNSLSIVYKIEELKIDYSDNRKEILEYNINCNFAIFKRSIINNSTIKHFILGFSKYYENLFSLDDSFFVYLFEDLNNHLISLSLINFMNIDTKHWENFGTNLKLNQTLKYLILELKGKDLKDDFILKISDNQNLFIFLLITDINEIRIIKKDNVIFLSRNND